MSEDNARSYDELKRHIGHNIECVAYGDEDNPSNVTLECEDCSEVIIDFDRPERPDAYEFECSCAGKKTCTSCGTCESAKRKIRTDCENCMDCVRDMKGKLSNPKAIKPL